MMKDVVLVYPDGARAQLIRDADGGVEVLGMHSGGEAVSSRVTKADGVGLVLELSDGAHGAEDFLLHDLHVFGHVGEDGGLDEVTFLAVAFATNLNLGPFLFAMFDVTMYFILVDAGATPSVGEHTS